MNKETKKIELNEEEIKHVTGGVTEFSGPVTMTDGQQQVSAGGTGMVTKLEGGTERPQEITPRSTKSWFGTEDQ